MTPTQPLDKASVIRYLLKTEGRVMLCLDASREGVDVPRRFRNDPALMLVFNTNMPQPIDIGKESVSSELRFGGIPHYCVIPYTALWSAFNPDTNHGMFWSDSVPSSVGHNSALTQLHSEGLIPLPLDDPLLTDPPIDNTPATLSVAPVVEEKSYSGLRVIQGGGEAKVDAGTPKSPKSHLRLVE